MANVYSTFCFSIHHQHTCMHAFERSFSGTKVSCIISIITWLCHKMCSCVRDFRMSTIATICAKYSVHVWCKLILKWLYIYIYSYICIYIYIYIYINNQLLGTSDVLVPKWCARGFQLKSQFVSHTSVCRPSCAHVCVVRCGGINRIKHVSIYCLFIGSSGTTTWRTTIHYMHMNA